MTLDEGSTMQSEPKKRGIAYLVGGSIAAVFAVIALGAGGVALWGNEAKRDDHGYFSTASHGYAADSRAIATDQVTIGAHAPTWLIGKARLEIGSTAKPVFVGIARKSDVDAYLAGVSHTLATNLDPRPFNVTYVPQPGKAVPGNPAAQTFWAASSTGTGERALTWNVRSGKWSIVLMNADGSPGVAADVGVGVNVPGLLWVSIGVAAFGLLLLVLAASLFALGLRPRTPGPTAVAVAA